MRLCFGEHVLDTAQRVLSRGGVELALEPKVFGCIELLASEPGKLITTARMRQTLWPGVHVADGALRRTINEARKALGDSGERQTVIRTRKGVGYVFLLEVAQDAAVPDTSSSAWPFVGRERELARLGDWLARKTGGLCFISAEAGGGKSSLLARLALERGSSTRWLVGRCRATLGLPAFWPFREIGARLMEDPSLRPRVSALVAQRPELLQLVPELMHNAPAQRAQVTASVETRFELCEALAALFRALARGGPLRLAIEDVHWADLGSLVMLEALSRAARDVPLHVFATYRPEAVAEGGALGQLIGRASGRDGTFSVHMTPLELEALRALLEQLTLRGSPVGSAQALLRLTGGNALYVHELVNHVLAAGSSLDAALPPSLQHIVAERVGVLSEVLQERLAQAAVLGDDFALVHLAALAGVSRADLDHELEPARRSGLLSASAQQPERLRFSHALVREALWQQLTPHQRNAYHCAALHALLSLQTESIDGAETAVHAFEAGDLVPREQRRQLCERAGRQAFAALAFDRAALQLGRARLLLAPNDDSPEAAELVLQWALASWHADAREEDVEAAFLEASERARRADAPATFGEAALGYALGDESSVLLRIASLRPKALDLVEEALAWLTRLGAELASWPGHLAYRLAAAQCWLRVEAGEPADMQRAAQRAMALAPEQLGTLQELWLLALRGAAEPERGAEVLDALEARLTEVNLDASRRIEIGALIMGTRLSRGEIAEWERAAADMARAAERLQQPVRSGRAGQRWAVYLTLPRSVPAARAVMRGELAAAEQHLRELVQYGEQLGLPRSREGSHVGFHIILQLLGYLGRAQLLEPIVDPFPENDWFRALIKAQIALERGDRVEATEHFARLRSMGLLPSQGGRALLAKPESLVRLSDVCVEVGENQDAAIVYRALASRAQRCIHDGTLISWGSGSRPLGALAFATGRFEDADRHYRDALAMNLSLGHRPEVARTRLGWARVMLADGRSTEAHALLAQAARDADDMGMLPLASLARALGQAAFAR
jgi:DNA-binding winged helix-turn-helix (wHTH) protein